MRFQLGSATEKTSKPRQYSPAHIRSTLERKAKRVVVVLPSKEEQGRQAWAYIHTTDDDPEVALRNFEKMIPSYGCSCRSDYAEIKKQIPPDTSSKESLWLWGVTVHNAVNRKLGKPEVSVEEARQLWRMNDDRTLGST